MISNRKEMEDARSEQFEIDEGGLFMNAQGPKAVIFPNAKGHYAAIYQYGANESRLLNILQQVATYLVNGQAGQDRVAQVEITQRLVSVPNGMVPTKLAICYRTTIYIGSAAT